MTLPIVAAFVTAAQGFSPCAVHCGVGAPWPRQHAAACSTPARHPCHRTPASTPRSVGALSTSTVIFADAFGAILGTGASPDVAAAPAPAAIDATVSAPSVAAEAAAGALEAAVAAVHTVLHVSDA